MSSSQSLISSVGDTHNAIHPKKPTENRGEWQENRAWRKETKKKRTCESYISRFLPKDSGWWEGGNQIETGKKRQTNLQIKPSEKELRWVQIMLKRIVTETIIKSILNKPKKISKTHVQTMLAVIKCAHQNLK